MLVGSKSFEIRGLLKELDYASCALICARDLIVNKVWGSLWDCPFLIYVRSAAVLNLSKRLFIIV